MHKMFFFCVPAYILCVCPLKNPDKKKTLCQKRKMSAYHHIFCFELTKDINHKYCQIMCICNSVRFGNFVVFIMVSLYSRFLCKAFKITRLMMWIFKLWYCLTVLVLVLNVDALFYCLSTWQFVIDKVLWGTSITENLIWDFLWHCLPDLISHVYMEHKVV
jgi:hypothetical protein